MDGTLCAIGRSRALLIVAVALLPGCRIAPREQLDDCRQLSQTLRSENARLKDQVLASRSQNQDLSERAVDDARRLAEQDEAINRLERSVHAYQEERGQLEDSFRELKASLPESTRTSATQPRLLEALERVASRQPSCVLDRRRHSLSVSTEFLFDPGTADLTPAARTWLGELSTILGQADIEGRKATIVSRPKTPAIQLTGMDDPSPDGSTLASRQLFSVRDALTRGVRSPVVEASIQAGDGSFGNDPRPGRAWAQSGTIEILVKPDQGTAETRQPPKRSGLPAVDEPAEPGLSASTNDSSPIRVGQGWIPARSAGRSGRTTPQTGP